VGAAYWPREEIPRGFVGLGELKLNSVDTIDTVNEQDQDEDEGDLHAVLDFCYQRTFAAWGLLVGGFFE